MRRPFRPAQWISEEPLINAAVSPGNFAVDLLRRCYRARVRVCECGRESVFRWVWAQEGAEWLPFSHAWGSAVYDDERDPLKEGAGEVPGGFLNFCDGDVGPFPSGPVVGPVQWHKTGVPKPYCPALPVRRPWIGTRTQTLDGLNAE